MTDIFHCGDHDALVAYLYDECDPGHREAIAAHLGHCPTCAEEVASLRATRRLLAAWAPPDASLGFQITRAEAPAPVTVLRPAAWWRQPLPAWAQAAAAALIFAAGLTLGSARGASETVARTDVAPAAAPAATAAVSTTAAVSRDEIAQLEQRLRAIESAARRAPAAPVAARAAVGDDALLERVRQLIDASEERQRRETSTMQAGIATLANYVTGLERQRRVDLRGVEERLGRIQGTTGIELQQQRDAINYFVRTSLTGNR